jgi:hypothetical protein
MAQPKIKQLQVRNRQRKILPISTKTRVNHKMTGTTTPESPHRNIGTTNRNDRLQQQQNSDTASVASTVKISNVATSSPLAQKINYDVQYSSISNRKSNINTIMDSRDDSSHSSSINRLKNNVDNYQRDRLIAPTNSNTGIDIATTINTGRTIDSIW